MHFDTCSRIRRLLTRVVSSETSVSILEVLSRCLLKATALLSNLSCVSSAASRRLVTLSSNSGRVTLVRRTERSLSRRIWYSSARHSDSQKTNSVVLTPKLASTPRSLSAVGTNSIQDAGDLGSMLEIRSFKSAPVWLHLSALLESGRNGTWQEISEAYSNPSSAAQKKK
ncbi:hypothetical protein M5K25_019628 [Dendrobium thyrsiflorum]|uniref:Uncharacterized protein n=1 Tax=Dendrobium thyrsiflorum TaxID=117978 RepID=A0ABD0UFP4_DENTH